MSLNLMVLGVLLLVSSLVAIRCAAWFKTSKIEF